MKRDFYNELLQWKQSNTRKPLILKGARQVGKTYILKEFGKKEYTNTAYFNFEEDPGLNIFFSGRIQPEKIIERLSIYSEVRILPQKTLIIFDEVQNSPETLTALKYFNEKANRYHIAAAGSLLGLKLGHSAPFPVGKVTFLNLYPFTFAEYLEAVGKKMLREYLQNKKDFEPLPTVFHEELIDFLKMYFFTGGMPEAIKSYLEDKNLKKIRQIQADILSTYLHDFSKHTSKSEAVRVTDAWYAIPGQLAKENKKFKYSEISKNARARDYHEAIRWLVDAGLVYKSYNIKTPKLPLSGYKEDNIFKLYLLDIGLLGALLNISARTIVEGNRLFSGYNGAFTENYAAQELMAGALYRDVHMKELYYWSSGSAAEVDFIVQYDERLYPLEVKAGTSRRKTSLKYFGEKYSPQVLSRATLLNFKQEKNLCNYPLYGVDHFPLFRT
ncbi:MAG: ATP-binding protein [Candidatus Aminicenantes bacterium]|nr:ATP-binding protein [Candidatus Aminicenantes bacterium]